MLNPPRTKEEAEAYRYDQWAGSPGGSRLNLTKCAYTYWRGFHDYQCSRKPGHGPANLYCKQHAKMVDA